jgi:hypothetical protein
VEGPEHHLVQIIPRCEAGSIERNFVHKQLAEFTYATLCQGMLAVGSLKPIGAPSSKGAPILPL